VVLAAWTPPHLAPREHWQPRWSQVVPFLAYYRHTDLAAMADLVREVSGFVPLGALLAVRHPRLSLLRIAAVGLGLGLSLEAGQLTLTDRTADVTDALSAGAGAVVGVALCRWGVPLRAGAFPD
jgi:glycopeptide antibiotics resistance protein